MHGSTPESQSDLDRPAAGAVEFGTVETNGVATYYERRGDGTSTRWSRPWTWIGR